MPPRPPAVCGPRRACPMLNHPSILEPDQASGASARLGLLRIGQARLGQGLLQRIPHLAAPLFAALLVVSVSGCSSNGPKIDEDVLYEGYAERALRYYEMDELGRAQEQANEALAVRQDDVPMRLLTGFISLRRGTTADLYVSQGLFEEMQGDDDPRVWLGLGTARERIGIVHEQTAQDLEQGRRLPEEFSAEFEANELREEAQEFWRDAIDAYERALDFNPEYLKALNGMLRTHVLLDQRELAETFGLRLLSVADRERQALREQLDRPGRSLTDRSFGRLREDYDNTFTLVIETQLALHDLYRGEDRLGPALEQLDRALALKPNRPELFGRRAELSMLMGRYDEALRDIDRLLSTSTLDLDHPDIQRAFVLQREARQQVARAAR